MILAPIVHLIQEVQVNKVLLAVRSMAQYAQFPAINPIIDRLSPKPRRPTKQSDIQAHTAYLKIASSN